MEIWDSLNRRYLDFIKKRGARREESWLSRGLREPGRGRAEELARRALVPGSGFLPKKGKAGKKCELAAGGEGEQRPRHGVLHGLLGAPGARAPARVIVAGAWSRRARRRVRRRLSPLCLVSRRATPPVSPAPAPPAAAMPAAEPPPPEDPGTAPRPNF